MITFEQYRQNPTIRNRNKLVQQNMGLVKFYANKIAQSTNVEIDDLIQVGYEALIKCVSRFDPSQGNKFSSYAVPFIRGSLQHYIRDYSRTIRTPRKYEEIVSRSRKINAQTHTEMAAALGVSVDEWKQAKAAHRHARSLEAQLSHEGGMSLIDTIATNNKDPYLPIMVDELLSTLPTKQRQIVEMHCFGEMTYKQIAEAIGNCEMTVCRNKKRAIKDLRNLVA